LKGDKDVVYFPTCLFVGQAMWYGRDSEGGRLCGEEGERVLHQRFGSTLVVDPGARHGIACRNPTLREVWGCHSHSRKWDLGVPWDSQKFRTQL
jgi:hypothetical protein